MPGWRGMGWDMQDPTKMVARKAGMGLRPIELHWLLCSPYSGHSMCLSWKFKVFLNSCMESEIESKSISVEVNI